MTLPRLRQAVLAARDLDAVAAELESALGISAPFHDAGVGHFGLRNAVYAVGDTFIEIVSPTRDGTAAGRHLDRIGGDGGYMCMVELADEAALRAQVAAADARVVHDNSHPDIVDVHLHPKDVPGAIVALDVCTPPGSWRWGGPAWTAAIPPHGSGGLRGLTVAVADPDAAAARWGAVVGVPTAERELSLDGGRQTVRFVPVDSGGVERIVGVDVAVAPGVGTGPVDIGGVTFTRRAEEDATP